MNRSRVVSLLPAYTQIICELGQGQRLAGRSQACDLPGEVRPLPACTVAGPTPFAQVLEPARLCELEPHLIFTQGKESLGGVPLGEVEQALSSPLPAPPQVVALAPVRLADLWSTFQIMAAALEVPEEGQTLVRQLKLRVVDIIETACVLEKRPTVACLEWLNPVMSAGNWMPELIDLAGGQPAWDRPGKPALTLDWNDLVKKDPEIIVVMPRGKSLEETRRAAAELVKKPEWKGLKAVRQKRVYLADGHHYFYRPSPLLVESMEALAEMLHPEIFRFGTRNRIWEQL